MSYYGYPLYPLSPPNQASVVTINATTTLGAGAVTYNKAFVILGAGAYTITLPAIDATNWSYGSFTILNAASASCTINVSSGTADTMFLLGGSYTSIALLPGERILVQNVTGAWSIGLESAQRTSTAPVGDNSIRIASTAYVQNNNIGVVGTMLNDKMLVAAASATATFTADEVVVETALGGVAYRVANVTQNINLATVGAGGMDTGSAPVSGTVVGYLIWGPSVTTSTLWINGGTTVQPWVYSGAHMPTGYTASALISCWATDSSGHFLPGLQVNRLVQCQQITFATTAVTVGSTLVTIPSLPPNAKRYHAVVSVSAATASTYIIVLTPTLNSAFGSGNGYNHSTSSTGGSSIVVSDIPIYTPQVTYYTATVGTTGATLNASINGYEF